MCLFVWYRFHSRETFYLVLFFMQFQCFATMPSDTFFCFEFIPVDKDVVLWTFIILADDHYFCLFDVQFQPFLSVFFFKNV